MVVWKMTTSIFEFSFIDSLAMTYRVVFANVSLAKYNLKLNLSWKLRMSPEYFSGVAWHKSGEALYFNFVFVRYLQFKWQYTV